MLSKQSFKKIFLGKSWSTIVIEVKCWDSRPVEKGVQWAVESTETKKEIKESIFHEKWAKMHKKTWKNATTKNDYDMPQ